MSGALSIYCQLWDHISVNTGVTPFGCSLHLSKEDAKEYVKDYFDKLPEKAIHEYKKPRGELLKIQVSFKIFERVQKEHPEPAILFQSDLTLLPMFMRAFEDEVQMNWPKKVGQGVYPHDLGFMKKPDDVIYAATLRLIGIDVPMSVPDEAWTPMSNIQKIDPEMDESFSLDGLKSHHQVLVVKHEWRWEKLVCNYP